MPESTKTTVAVRETGQRRRSYEELERENRAQKAIIQEWEERRQGPSDAEGFFGKPALQIGHQKNLADVFDAINWLQYAAQSRPAGFPDDPPIGVWGAILAAHVRLSAAIRTLAVFEPQHPNLVRDLHRLLNIWLSPPFVFKLLRPPGDTQGFVERMKFMKAVEGVVYGPAVQWVFSTAHEVETVPIEAERKGRPG